MELLDGSGNPVLVNGQPMTTVTDANGYYRFDNLSAGQYQVRVAASNFATGGKLFGYVSSSGQSMNFSTAGNNHDHGDNPANPAVSGVKSAVVTLSANNPTGEVDNGATGSGSNGLSGDANDNLTVDFGFWPAASLGSYVWYDQNGNGIKDAGELPIAGVTVTLYDDKGNKLGTTQTDATGFYMFDNLPPGNYVVEFTPPPGYVLTRNDQGANDGIDSDANPLTKRTKVITLTEGENNPTLWAGVTNPASLGSYVWNDGLKDKANGSRMRMKWACRMWL